MDWANERYIRVYTRDSTTWKLLDWRGRMVLVLMMRKATRAGVIDVDGHGALGLAALIEAPVDIVEAGLAQLTNERIAVVRETPSTYVIPKFLDAQEAVQTTAHRSREYRARQRDEAMATVTKSVDPVTKRDATVTKRSYSPGGPSLLSDPSLTDQSRAGVREITTTLAEPPTSPEPEPSRLPAISTDPDQIKARRLLGDWGLDELNRIRMRVGSKFGMAGVQPVPIMGRPRTDLAERLRDAGDKGEVQLRHVLRIAEIEAVAKQTVEYLGGSIFGDTSWAKKLAMTERDVTRTIGSRPGDAPARAMRMKQRSDDDLPPGAKP